MISVRSSGLGRDKDALTQDVELRPAIQGLLRPVPEVHEPTSGSGCCTLTATSPSAWLTMTGWRRMPATRATIRARDTAAEVAFLTRALKALTLR